MKEAWRDACVMGTEREENEQMSGDDDASQQDAASVSKDISWPYVIFIAVLWLKLHSILNPSVTF